MIGAETYERVALEDGDDVWELACGRLRAKPPVTWEHGGAIRRLAMTIARQIDEGEFEVGTDVIRVRVSTGSYYVPDVAVVPSDLARRVGMVRPGRLEVFDDPLPLVVEVWSPSTGDYDVETKLLEYQRRGDREIWLVHPYERTVTVWLLQAGGTYRQVIHREGEVTLTALPGVRIQLQTLFG